MQFETVCEPGMNQCDDLNTAQPKISLVNVSNLQETVDLVTFSEETLGFGYFL